MCLVIRDRKAPRLILVKAGLVLLQMGDKSSIGRFLKRRGWLFFLLTNLSIDVKREGKRDIIEWHTHSPTKINAVAESRKECKHLVHIKDGHNALIFDNSLYTQDDIVITPRFTPRYVCICTTFSVEQENDQLIVTDFDPDNPDLQF